MYDTVLLPTDTSRGVDEAIEYAIEAAKISAAELHVLYVVDTEAYSSYPADEYVHELEGLERALEQTGRDAVAEIAERAASADVPVETIIRHGVPHEEILRYMDERDVGLTVLGSKHRTKEYRQLLGNVAERVARHTIRPVAIVKTQIER